MVWELMLSLWCGRTCISPLQDSSKNCIFAVNIKFPVPAGLVVLSLRIPSCICSFEVSEHSTDVHVHARSNTLLIEA